MDAADREQQRSLGVSRAFIRVLLLQATKEELLTLNAKHFAVGLLFTWLVGIGRYWDSPVAEPLQKLGLGSVIYVFVLSAFLWLVVWPLKPQNWSYFRLLTYITLTSPPAALYALPVERWIGLDSAISANLIFLWTVACWRVALLFRYLHRVAELRQFTLLTAGAAPIALILFSLTLLNLHKVVFDFMGGFHHRPGAHDAAYGSLVFVTITTYVITGPLSLAYIFLAIKNYGKTVWQKIQKYPLVFALLIGLIGFGAFNFSKRSGAVEEADKAEELLSQQRIDEAQKVANECIAKYPNEADCYLSRARIYKSQGKPSQAIADLQTASKLDPMGRVYGHWVAEEVCLEVGDWDNAVKFNATASHRPFAREDIRDIFKEVAYLQFQGKTAEADKAIDRAVSLAEASAGSIPVSDLADVMAMPEANRRVYYEYTNLSRALTTKALALAQQKNFEKSAEFMFRATQLNPTPDNRFLLAAIWCRTSQADKGQKLLSLLGSFKGEEFAQAWMNARVAALEKKYVDSLKFYNTAIAFLAPSKDAHVNVMDRSLALSGRTALILEAAEMALQAQNPSESRKILDSGLVLMETDQSIQALVARALFYQRLNQADKSSQMLAEARQRGYKGSFPPPTLFIPTALGVRLSISNALDDQWNSKLCIVPQTPWLE